MHELGLAQMIVDTAIAHSQGARVRRVTVAIGQLSAVMPDAIQFCFDTCCQGTIAEGAALEIVEIPGLARCRQCGAEFAIDQPFGICDCGSTDLEFLQGHELTLKQLELEPLCA